jgi:hypothetical protein
MKAIKYFIVFISLFTVSACATTPIKLAEKYDFGDRLEEVDEILRYNLMGWDAIDRQSFILQTTPSSYYLIVLRRPSYELMFAESISITHTGAMVKTGFDKVTVYGPSDAEEYVIHKIYNLGDREQMKAIKAQLKENTKS